MIFKLIGTMLAFIGFIITALISLLGGNDPLIAVVKSIAVFFVLWIVFSIIAALIQSKLPEDVSLINEMGQKAGFGRDEYIPGEIGPELDLNIAFDQGVHMSSADNDELNAA